MSATLLYAPGSFWGSKSSKSGLHKGEYVQRVSGSFLAPRTRILDPRVPVFVKKKSFFSVAGGYLGNRGPKCEIWGPRGGVRGGGSWRGVWRGSGGGSRGVRRGVQGEGVRRGVRGGPEGVQLTVARRDAPRTTLGGSGGVVLGPLIKPGRRGWIGELLYRGRADSCRLLKTFFGGQLFSDKIFSLS